MPCLLCCACKSLFRPVVFNSTKNQLHSNHFKELEAILSKALGFDSSHWEEQGGMRRLRLQTEDITISLTFLEEPLLHMRDFCQWDVSLNYFNIFWCASDRSQRLLLSPADLRLCEIVVSLHVTASVSVVERTHAESLSRSV